jgi:hypothetical protein
MFIKDNGVYKPDIWNNNINENVLENNNVIMGENKEINKVNQVQPIIYIIDASSLRQGNNIDNNRNYRGKGIFLENIFYFIYKIKKLIKIILIAGIIIIGIVLITHPDLLDKLFVGLFKKLGIYNMLMNIKKFVR